MLKCNDFPELSLSFSTLVHLLRYRAQDQPDRIAFTFLPEVETASFSLTYQELDRRSRAIAAQLQELNLSGERALLLYPPGLDYLTAFFGCLYAGVVAVPAYPPRNQRNTPRIQAVVADAGAAIALTTTAIQSKTQSLLQDLCRDLQWLTTDNLADGIEANWQPPLIDQDTLAFLQYTSGSTGTPKGVMLSHGNLLHNATMTYHFMGHSPNSKFVSWLPTYHDMGLIGGILQPLYGGFPCILMSPVSFLQRPYRWLETISRYQGTTSGGPNFAYELCIQKITAEQRETLDLSSWSVAFNGAEPIRQDTLERFSAAFACCGFRQEAFYPCYGLAEASLMVSGSRKLEAPVITTVQGDALERNQVIEATTSNENVRTLVSCGQTLPDQQIVIAHPDTLNRCSADEVGEIWVSGSSIGKGYWNRTEETEQTFCAYLSDTKEGPFLRTGDLGFLHNGELFITGRAKDLIIIRGRNLYPQDIELTAERSHASLRTGSGAAFSVQVSNEEQLVVVQEVEFRQKPNVEEVTAAIRQAVAEEHEVQVYAVVLIKAGSIPKTSSGKIQRRACKAEFLARNLDILGSSILDSADFEKCDRPKHLNREALLEVAPEERLPLLESYLQELVARVLRITPSFGLQQPISTLGLDSLKVFELKNQIEIDFGVGVSVVDLFEGASIAEIAKHILDQLAEISVVSAIQPIARNQDIPLSFAQERLWFLDQLEPGNSFYNLAATVRLIGELNIDAIAQSLNEIIRRHEVLRTTFSHGEGQPIQVVSPEYSLGLPVIDLSTYSNSERDIEIERLSIEEAKLPFNITHQPLLRAKILRFSEKEHTLILTVHHIVFDGWSMGVFVRELATLYQAFSSKNALPLPALPIQYADFTVWQRQWLQGEVLDTQLTYWKQQLSGSLPVLNLPTDFQRPPVQTYHGARQEFQISKSLTEALTKLSQQEDTTLFMTLLAGFKTLLYRYTNQEDILVGSPIANRNRAEIENLIGFFVNTLVLRTNLQGNSSFKELLHQVREVALGAYAHQDLPFEKLVSELQPERDLSYSPLFQVSFVMQNGLTQTLELPELKLSFTEVDTQTAKFDITLLIEEFEQGLIGTFEYNTDLFISASISRMVGHFQTLLAGIVAHPEANISNLPLLTQAEQYQLLSKWNNSHVNYPQDRCIHQLFETQVEQTPDAVAVVFEDQKLTYRELNQKANQLAYYLQELGVQPEMLVGICVERSLEMLVGLLGILKAGAAYVPLDPAYPQERLAFMLEDTQAPILLTQQRLLETIPQHNAKVVCLDTDWKTIQSQTQNSKLKTQNSSSLAYVIYTSGSTGKPKGVAIEHHSTVTLLNWAKEVFTPEDLAGVLASTSICFDLSVFELFVPLSWGGSVILAENALHLPTLPAANNVTLINTVPSAIAQLLQIDAIPSSVRTINLAGEALPANLVQQLYQINTIQNVFNLYGPSEDTTYSTYAKVEPDARGSVTIGRPIANTQVYILDYKQQLVPIGVSGELYIGGDGLARGYLNRPELTAHKFIKNPFSQEANARLYKTGDLARYLPDGNIEFLGRIDHQVKIRGFRIELGEIEAVLEQYPAVQQAVLVAREDEPGNKRLVAYLLPNQELSINDLRSFLKDKLPEYMVPSAFVLLEALPMTPNGKLDRKALPAPDTARPELEKAFVAPRTPEEKVLANIWTSVLGLKQVGINDNFFELGGHSLLATRLIAKVREAFQVELPLRSLFQYPTVASLVSAIAVRRRASAIAVHPKVKDLETQHSINSLPTIAPDWEQLQQPFPLTDIQQAYWIGRRGAFELSNVATHIYIEIESVNLDLERFNLAWQRLIERHDMLRAIVLPDGQQQILKQVPAYQIPVLDLRGQSSDVVNTKLEAVRESLSHQVLPTDKWPLFEIRASRLDNQKVRLHFSFDALMGDAWSFQILGRELAQLAQNPEASFSPLEISFRDYVLAELAHRHSELYQRSLDCWQQRIPTLPPAPELPLAQSISALKYPRFVRRSSKLAADTWQRLKTKANQAGVTPSGILLAAFAEVLTVWSKTPRFTIGLTLFNRLPLHPQVNDLVGDFTSLTLLAVDNLAQDTFETRVRHLQGQLWDDLDHRYFSGVQVLRELARIQGRNTAALMPVVFTSTLTQEALDKQAFPLEWLGERIYEITQTPQVFLDHQVFEEAGALVFNWDAVEELFPVGMLDDMFAAYCNFIQRLANEEESWQEANPKLIPQQQLHQLATINATDATVPAELLHTLFASQVRQRPEQVAVVASNRTLTYQELYCRANQLGRKLQQAGVKPNQLVAVVMEKGWEQVVGVLGILNSGAAYVPVDPKLPQERRSHLLAQAEVQVVVTQSWLNNTLEFPEKIQRICVDTEELANESDRALDIVQKPEDIAYVIYTSGSTGLPKGVTIDHRGAVNTIVDINQRFNVQPSDKVLALSSLSFDLSVYDIFGTLAAGGTIILPDARQTQDPAHWAELMRQEKVTIWNSVPALMQMMVEYAIAYPKLLQSLRLVLLSGDWIPLNLPAQIQVLSEGIQVISLGGATEASIWSILYPIAAVNPIWKSIPYGQPMKNQRFYVLNEALEVCPVWVPGQLYIGGIGLAKGYWRDRVKTAASFITHPQTGERLYRTGDLGRYLPDGNIEFIGREDFQVKISGYRLELGEIETALIKHPAVREAVVSAVGEQQSNKRLVAYIIPNQEIPTIEDLRQFLNQKLPAYMVPSSFMMLDTLPLTSNGKVNRQALPAPDWGKSELNESFVAPRTSVEKKLAEVWCQILNLQQVDIHKNFFCLGGDSILATQMISKIREAFQVEIPLCTLFDMPTIAGLSEQIEQSQGNDSKTKKSAIKPTSRDAYRTKLSSLKKGTGN